MEGLAHIFRVAPSKDIEYAYQSTPEARAEFQRRVDEGVEKLLKTWKDGVK